MPFNGTGSNVTSLNASNISSGTVPTARLASGTANSSTYLRGDQTWATVAAGLTGLRGQVFTSSGTYTIPSGVTQIKATIIGGGGGGGPGNGFYDPGYGNAFVGLGGSGGGGGSTVKYLTGLTSGNTITVTVGGGGGGGNGGGGGGTGGTSSISSGTQAITTVSANGGNGGAAAYQNSGGSGGGGGSTANGDLAVNGSNGSGRAGVVGQTLMSTNSTGYGIGGGGNGQANGSWAGGGSGAAGIVIIEW